MLKKNVIEMDDSELDDLVHYLDLTISRKLIAKL